VLVVLGHLDQARDHAERALLQRPVDREMLLLLGDCLVRLERPMEAVSAFQRVLALDGNHPDALTALADLYRGLDSFEAELDILERLATRDPRDMEVRIRIANRLWDEGRRGEALPWLRQVFSLEPHRVDVALRLAELEDQQERPEEAWRVLQILGGRAPHAPGLRDASVGLARTRGLAAAGAGQVPYASLWFERLLSVAPDDEIALDHLTTLYPSQSRMADLVRLLQAFADRHPDDVEAIARLAGAMVAAGRIADAVRIYAKVVELRPEDAAVRKVAVDLALQHEMTSEARHLMVIGRDVRALPPADRLAYATVKSRDGHPEEAWSLFESLFTDVQLGEEARRLGLELAVEQARDLEPTPVSALVWWERALQGDPLDEANARAAAILYRQIKRGADAVRVLRKLPERYRKPEILREYAAACDVANLYEEGHEAYTALAAREGRTPESLVHLCELSLGAGKLQRAWEECEALERLDAAFPKLRPLQARVTSAIARDLERQENHREAVSWWQRHLSCQPDSVHRKDLAVAQIAIGDVDGAVLSYRAWFRRHTTDIEVALWLGKNDLGEGLFSEAREYFEAVLELRPNNLEALHGLAQSAAGEGNDDEALRLFGRILALEKDHIPAALALAEQAIEQGEDIRAVELLKRVLSQNPQHAEARSMAVEALRRQALRSRGIKAERLWGELLEIDPDDPEALRALAHRKASSPQVEPAVVAQAYQDVLDVEPLDPEARLMKAAACLESGNLGEAEELLAPEELGDTARGAFLLARIAVARDQFDVARERLTAALQVDPELHEARLALACLLGRQRDEREAWEHLRLLPADHAVSPAEQEIIQRVARSVLPEPIVPGALPDLELLLRLCPHDLEGRLQLANVHLAMGERRAAIKALLDLLGRSPRHVEAAHRVADLLAEEGRPGDAQRILQSVAEQSPLETPVRQGRIHLKAGDRGRAREAFERVLLEAPTHREARFALADLACEEADGTGAWGHLEALASAHPGDASLRQAVLERMIALAQRLEGSVGLEWWVPFAAWAGPEPDVLAQTARMQQASGDPAEAIASLERLLLSAPHDHVTARELALLLIAEGQRDRARDLLGQAAQQGDSVALQTLGRLALESGEAAVAAAWYERAVAALPEDLPTYLKLVAAHEAVPDPVRALAAVERLLAREAGHPAGLAARMRLRRQIALERQDLAMLAALGAQDASDLELHEAHLAAARAARSVRDVRLALERMLALRPDQGAWWHMLGVTAQADGASDLAARAWHRAHELGVHEATGALVDLLAHGERWDEIAPLVITLESRGPLEPSVAWWAVRVAVHQGDVERLWAVLAGLWDRGIDRERAWPLLRDVLVRQLRSATGDAILAWLERGIRLGHVTDEFPVREAIEAFDRAEGVMGAGRLEVLEALAVTRQPPVLAALARELGRLGQHERAVQVWKEAVTLQPSQTAWSFELARSLLALGAPDLALRWLETRLAAHASDERHVALQTEAHRVLVARQEGPEGIPSLLALLERDPDWLDGWRDLVRRAERAGDVALHLKALVTVARLDPEDVQIAQALGVRAWIEGELEAARTLLTGHLEVAGPEALAALHDLAGASGDQDLGRRVLARWEARPGTEASSILDVVLTLLAGRREPGPGTLVALARRALERGEESQATSWLDRARQAGAIEAERILGEMAFSKGRLESAVQHLALYCQARLRPEEAHATLANALVRLGRLDEATPWLERCSDDPSLGPLVRPLLDTVRRARAREESHDGAYDRWREILAENPEDVEALTACLEVARQREDAGLVLEWVTRLSRLEANRPAWLVVEGAWAIVAGQPRRAYEVWLRAHQAGVPDLLAPLGWAALACGALPEALRLIPLASWLALDPGFVAHLAWHQGRLDEAWQTLGEPGSGPGPLDALRRAILDEALATVTGTERNAWLERALLLLPGEPDLWMERLSLPAGDPADDRLLSLVREALSRHPEHPPLLALARDLLSGARQWVAALEVAERLVWLSPSDDEARGRAVDVAMSAARSVPSPALAIPMWRRVLGLAPRHLEAREGLLGALVAAHEQPAALTLAREILGTHPESRVALALVAEDALATGGLEAAWELVQLMVGHAGQHQDFLARWVLLAIAEGQVERAESVVAVLESSSPALVALVRARIAADHGDWSEARAHLAPLLEQQDAQAIALATEWDRHLALQLEERGDWERAAVAWRDLTDRVPGDLEARLRQCRCLVRTGQLEQARACMPDLSDLPLDRAGLWVAHEVLVALERPGEADATLGRLVEVFRDPDAVLGMAEKRMRDAAFDAARDLVEPLVGEGYPGSGALLERIQRTEARTWTQEGYPERAEPIWRRLLAAQPGDVEARQALARVLLARGEVQEALIRMEALDHLEPDLAILKAEALMGQDRHDEAALLIEPLLVRGRWPAAWLVQARLHQLRRELPEAGDACQQALASHPDDRVAGRARWLAAYVAHQLAEAARLQGDLASAWLMAELWEVYQGPSRASERFKAELAQERGDRLLADRLHGRLFSRYEEARAEADAYVRNLEDPSEALALLEKEPSIVLAEAIAHRHELAEDWAQAAELRELAFGLAPADPGRGDLAMRAWHRAGDWDRAHAILMARESIGELDPQDLELAVDCCLRTGRDAEALAYLEQGALTGGRPDFALQGVTLLLAAGRAEDAWEWIERAVAHDPAPALLAMAPDVARACAEVWPEPAQQLPLWETVVGWLPLDVEARLSWARALELAGDPDRARGVLEETLAVAPSSLRARLMLVEGLLETGHLERAREANKLLLREAPDLAEAHQFEVLLAHRAGEHVRVWELGQQLLARGLDTPQVRGAMAGSARQLARSSEAQGQDAEAIRLWDLVLLVDPESFEALEALAEAYAREQRWAESVGVWRTLVTRQPDDLRLAHRHGEIAAMGGFFDEAREAFLRVLERDPGRNPSRQALALSEIGLGRFDAAIACYLDAIARDPDDRMPRIGLGQLLLGMGQAQDAFEHLARACELSADEPDRDELLPLFREAATRSLDELSAREAWDEALSRLERWQAIDSLPEVGNRLAETHLRAGRRADAMAALARHLERWPTDPRALSTRALLYRLGGDSMLARREYEAILAEHPGFAPAHLGLAQMLWDDRVRISTVVGDDGIRVPDANWPIQEARQVWEHLEAAHRAGCVESDLAHLRRRMSLYFAERAQQESQFALAIRWWEMALRLEPSDVETMRRIARAQVLTHDLAAAARTYGRLLEAHPREVETALLLADLYRRLGDLRSEEVPLQRVVSLDPRHVDSRRRLMHIARDRGNPPEALRRAYDLLDVEPRDIDALMLLVWAHEQMLERRAAMDVCEQIIQIEPNHAEAHHTLGRLARDQGNLEKARTSVRYAIHLQPSGQYYHTLGTIYQLLRQLEEARGAFEQAVRRDPDLGEAQADLGMLWLRSGELARARPLLEQAVRLIPPENERAMEVKQALMMCGPS